MKLLLIKKTRSLENQSIIHLVCIAVLISLCVIVPILHNLTGAPPYWAIILIFSIPCAIYLIIVFTICIRRHKETDRDVQGESEETIRIQAEEDTADVVSSIETSSYYNPSTTGIPPSSFLAPTVHQPSIRSSSLDYSMNPPPPAYQETLYPPSYRSTNSTKDDRQSCSY